MTTLALFYIYCFLIKLLVRDWIKEYNWAQQLNRQKREKVTNQKNFNISDLIN